MLTKAFKLKSFLVPTFMLVLMWSFFLLQNIGFFGGCSGALIPLMPEGLKGVIFAPLLHGNLDHIVSNSMPIAILLFLLFEFYPKIATRIFLIGWIASGLLVWMLPPIDIVTGQWNYSCIVGASGLVYMLAFFIFFSGVFRWNMKLLTISLLVALYYGSLIWGIFPEEFFSQLQEPSKISWQSHLAGSITGVILALIFRKIGEEKKRKFIWEYPNYYNERDDKMWQEYIANHPEDFEELPQLKQHNIWEYLDEIRRNEK
ncbi:rhomboid family intramembrane serine protease [Epilithonimonas hispanica]|uniref:Rhomboid family intramembrane serine protease n=1 Tax=Epilithonimonas hispanica TaxID=358687 RepID=A0A3D9D2T7_9FLAO|nr:rhomboid family intramembrane serine protease [Epilithonimonas hispanica]REC72326.1 rhomboid family intramembrane serine protease [Epilithonimonas hispanica]